MTKEEIIERIEFLLELSKQNMEYYESKYETTEATFYYYSFEEEYGKVEILKEILKEVKEND